MDVDTEHKKAKGIKKYTIKRILVFKDYKDCLFNDKIILQSQQRFRSDHHNVCTVQIIRLREAVTMIRDYKHLIKLQRIHTE